MNGAASNPDAHTFAYAAAQVKKGLETAKKLGAENFGKSFFFFVQFSFFNIYGSYSLRYINNSYMKNKRVLFAHVINGYVFAKLVQDNPDLHKMFV